MEFQAHATSGKDEKTKRRQALIHQLAHNFITFFSVEVLRHILRLLQLQPRLPDATNRGRFGSWIARSPDLEMATFDFIRRA